MNRWAMRHPDKVIGGRRYPAPRSPRREDDPFCKCGHRLSDHEVKCLHRPCGCQQFRA